MKVIQIIKVTKISLPIHRETDSIRYKEKKTDRDIKRQKTDKARYKDIKEGRYIMRHRQTELGIKIKRQTELGIKIKRKTEIL